MLCAYASVIGLTTCLTADSCVMFVPCVVLVSPFLPPPATVGVVTERNAEKAIEELKAYEVRAVLCVWECVCKQ